MLMIYGASGYTGQLIARMAIQHEIPCLIAGRNAEKLHPLAKELCIDYRAFSLDAPRLEGVTALINCASPFSLSTRPLVEACIQHKIHYTDITGETKDMETVHEYDSKAKEAGIMLMPGIAFGVVPTDCLAAFVSEQLPTATHLTIAFKTSGGVSQGTLETLFGGLHEDGLKRIQGVLITAKPAEKTRMMDFGEGLEAAVLNPWRGDLTTAYTTTRITNIETYTAFPGVVQWLMKAHWFHTLWGSRSFQSLLQSIFKRLPAGPSEKVLREGYTVCWAEVTDGISTVSARLRGPEAYAFSALTATAIAKQLLAQNITSGFQTPAGVYGADFVLSLPGVQREIIQTL